MENMDDNLAEELKQYESSYRELVDKIEANHQDKTKQASISGWINDCRLLIEKIRDVCLKIVSRGGDTVLNIRDYVSGNITKYNISEADIKYRFDRDMKVMDELERRNNMLR